MNRIPKAVYTKEFREEAVKLAMTDGVSVSEAARRLSISMKTLANWSRCKGRQELDGLIGISGWKWVLIFEGIPPVILGIYAFIALPDRVEAANWLNEGQRKWLQDELKAKCDCDEQLKVYGSFKDALKAPIVWCLGFLYFLLGFGFFSVMIWLPQMVKQIAGLTVIQTSVVSAVPFLLASIAMAFYAGHSHKTGERQNHLVVAYLVGAAGLFVAAMAQVPIWSFVGICVAAVGMWSATGVFWPIPTGILSGRGAVGGIALINSVGILGGFVGPYLVGLIRGWNQNYSVALACLAMVQLIAALIASQLHRSKAIVGGVIAAQTSEI
ncbi:MAG: MFS transporter [Paraburkholderia fungorum]|nr:MAG: MFS transporter [Paraburkholderia fungorum]